MLSERQEKLLNTIIRQYVKTAEPVGSMLLSGRRGLDFSPATIRNEMQDLEELGFLYQPHTSAGRIPTDRAYRYFVDNLLDSGELIADAKSRERINSSLDATETEPRHINRAIANILSELSETAVIANIDQSADFYKTGLSGLFGFPEFREFDRMFQMTNFFDRFDEMFDRIEREFFGSPSRRHEQDGINVMIGRENPFHNMMRDESVLCAKYRLPMGYAGTMTMIGPMRMNYGRNIGLMAYAVQALNRAAES